MKPIQNASLCEISLGLILLFFMGSRTAYADEPIDSDVDRDSEVSLDLAKTRFPLQSQERFEDELSQLRDVFAAKIRHTRPYDYPGGKVLNPELNEIFDLLSVWPSQEMRQLLVEHFESSEVYVIENAEALLAFQDESLREIVKQRSGYEREGQLGCLCYTETIDALLKLEPAPQQRFHPLETMLPPKKEGVVCWPEGMTCPQAILQLQDENLSIRLQSWTWLAKRGIVAPTGAVRESWPLLTEEQKWYILSIDPEYLGADRLLAFYEEVNRTASPKMRGELLARRVELGSESAKAEARDILRRTFERDDWEALLSKSPAEEARDAICGAPDPEDIPMLVRFRGARDEWIAKSGMIGLFTIDHPDAIKEVENILMTPRQYDFIGLMVSLPQQANKNLKHRWLYLGAIAKALQQRTDYDFDYALLVSAFYSMSGRNFGWNGIAFPSGFDEEAAQKAAKKCLEWYAEERPALVDQSATSPASVSRVRPSTVGRGPRN